jgi:hypothetical protein
MTTPSFTLERNPRGRLVCTLADGTRREDVVPVRAFPLSAPNDGISIVGADGHELLWIARLDAVPEALRALIAEELAAREFVPVIDRLLAVSTFATPSVWTVATDRGETKFTLKGEEDIRRLPNGALLITDSHGVGYRVRDRFALDRHSRKLIERFL